jgi:hypothetical protein
MTRFIDYDTGYGRLSNNCQLHTTGRNILPILVRDIHVTSQMQLHYILLLLGFTPQLKSFIVSLTFIPWKQCRLDRLQGFLSRRER